MKVSHNLRKLSRLIWLLTGGGGALFVLILLILAATHPTTPADKRINQYTVWLFFPSVLMVAAGVYLSLRYWRCPYCGCPLSTRYPIPRECPRCGRDVGLYD